MTDIDQKADAAAIKAFENDLVGMDAEAVRQAVREAQEQIDEIEPWLEALHAYARANNMDLSTPDSYSFG